LEKKYSEKCSIPVILEGNTDENMSKLEELTRKVSQHRNPLKLYLRCIAETSM